MCIQRDFLYELVFLKPKVTGSSISDLLHTILYENVTVDAFIHLKAGNKKTGGSSAPTLYSPLVKRKEGRNFWRVLGVCSEPKSRPPIQDVGVDYRTALE
jgi:hypothetical protein